MRFGNPFDNDTSRLVRAIETSKAQKASEMIESGVEINVNEPKEGITPLQYLLYKQDKEAMTLALSLGADPDLKNNSGDSAVTIAAGAEDDELLEIVLKAGGNPNAIDRNKRPAIYGSIGEERKEQIKLFIKYGVDLNNTDGAGQTAGFYGALLNKYEIVYFLIEEGLDPTIPNKAGVGIAWLIHDSLSRNLLNPEYPSYEWAIKVKQQLVDRGVKFPPPGASELRWRSGKPSKFDIERRDKKIKDGVPLESYEKKLSE